MIKKYLLTDPIALTIAKIPSIPGIIIRSIAYAIMCKKSPLTSIFGDNTRITYPERVSIGTHFTLNYLGSIDGRGEVIIGNHVRIGEKTTILTTNHKHKQGKPFHKQGTYTRPVIIKDNVWIGANVTIIPGVRICNDVVIGAGSVITKSINESGVYAGNPARKKHDLQPL